MQWYQMVVLAVVQGVTEFLPISSSAHLILVPHFLGWTDQGLGFDMATNVGTLGAVMIYFRRDVARLLDAWVGSMFAGRRDDDTRMAWGLIIATVPVLVFGLVLGLIGEDVMRLPWIIALASIVFGVLLGVIDLRAPRTQAARSLTWRGYVGIGFAQAVALIPGSSRAGMTILGARAAGLTRRDAARVSFFMAMPVTLAAILFEVLALVSAPAPQPWGQMAMAALLAGITAMIAIHYFMRMLQSMSMMPFVIYRVLLGLLILAVFGFSG